MNLVDTFDSQPYFEPSKRCVSCLGGCFFGVAWKPSRKFSSDSLRDWNYPSSHNHGSEKWIPPIVVSYLSNAAILPFPRKCTLKWRVWYCSGQTIDYYFDGTAPMISLSALDCHLSLGGGTCFIRCPRTWCFPSPHLENTEPSRPGGGVFPTPNGTRYYNWAGMTAWLSKVLPFKSCSML